MRSNGCTFVDVLAVCAVLAVGGGTLGVSLEANREASGSMLTGQNMQAVAFGINSMMIDDGFLTPTFLFGADRTGVRWELEDQVELHPNRVNGIVHYSGLLLERGYLPDEALFTSATAPSGGAPRLNPGPNPDDWEPLQINDFGQAFSNDPDQPQDRQASRLGFISNHALMSGNRLNLDLLGTPRGDMMLSRDYVDTIVDPSTLLLAEARYVRNRTDSPFDDNPWQPLAQVQASRDGPVTYRAYRPSSAFLGGSSDRFVYNEPSIGSVVSRFFYPDPRRSEQIPCTQLPTISNGAADSAMLYAPSTMSLFGKQRRVWTARIDGGIERLSIHETVVQRRWGEQYHTLTGTGRNIDPDRWANGNRIGDITRDPCSAILPPRIPRP